MALDMLQEHDATGHGRSLQDELHGHYIEDLAKGMTALYARTVTEADLVIFAGVSGDTNPLHLNQEFAAHGVFEGRVAHGMLTASFVSTVLGTKLPGPGSIYLSQTLRFKAPVRIGDTVNARATVVDVNAEKRRVTLATVCTVANEVVLEGEAQVVVPSRAA